MLNKLLDLIYPPVCGICGKIDSNSLCKKCEIKINKQAIFGVDNYKTNKEKIFDEHLYVFKYNGIIRDVILNYKFNERAYLYKTFVKILLKNENFVEIIKSYDIIMPVPLNKKREKARGYNQSALIATELSKKLGLKIATNNLIKIKNTVEQSSLNKTKRQKNLKGAYKLTDTKNLKNKKVLLIDDIYTTGSTANECSRIVKKAHVQKIGILTIAKD